MDPKISQFLELSGTSDTHVAEFYLASSGNDVNRALDSFFLETADTEKVLNNTRSSGPKTSFLPEVEPDKKRVLMCRIIHVAHPALRSERHPTSSTLMSLFVLHYNRKGCGSWNLLLRERERLEWSLPILFLRTSPHTIQTMESLLFKVDTSSLSFSCLLTELKEVKIHMRKSLDNFSDPQSSSCIVEALMKQSMMQSVWKDTYL